jgi:hypothetical protein
MNYDGRRFRPVTNTPNGEVNGETLFHYFQQDDLLTATYSGGGIRHGQMTGRVYPDGSLHFLYQHISDTGEFRAGECRSIPHALPGGRLRLHESWQWLTGDQSRGESVVEEVA